MGDNALIGGLIVVREGTQRVVVRALGPSLGQAGVAGALRDPTVELHDRDGTLLAANDNWRDTQKAEIVATGLAPTNNLESAIVAVLPSSPAGSSYTAIVRGADGGTGVALIEVYALSP